MLNAAADSALQLAQTLQAEGEPWCTALIPSAAEVSVSEEQQRAALAVACLQLQPDQLDAVHAQLSLSARAAVKLARSASPKNLDSLAEPHTLAHSELFLHPTILPCDLLCGHMLR